MAAYRFGHSSCNSGPFPFKIGLKYAHLQGLYCSRFNQLQLVFFSSVLLGFCGFFILESENCNCRLQKNRLQSGFFTGFFWLLQLDFETLLVEFERLAWSAPPGDPEAYGCNLEEDKGDSDINSELDEQEINVEVLGKQLTLELEDNEDGDDEIY